MSRQFGDNKRLRKHNTARADDIRPDKTAEFTGQRSDIYCIALRNNPGAFGDPIYSMVILGSDGNTGGAGRNAGYNGCRSIQILIVDTLVPRHLGNNVKTSRPHRGAKLL